MCEKGTIQYHIQFTHYFPTHILVVQETLSFTGKNMAKKTIKLQTGTVYQKEENGNYYFRYQINGQRKAVSLKTKNQKLALQQAADLIPIIKADSTEIISAHVQHAKGLKNKTSRLDLDLIWEKYAKHPERLASAIAHGDMWLRHSPNQNGSPVLYLAEENNHCNYTLHERVSLIQKTKLALRSATDDKYFFKNEFFTPIKITKKLAYGSSTKGSIDLHRQEIRDGILSWVTENQKQFVIVITLG
jgi:hypothetical protein